MAEAPQTREELLAARVRVRRQIEILECGPVLSRDGTPLTPALLDQLRDVLDEIDAELAALK